MRRSATILALPLLLLGCKSSSAPPQAPAEVARADSIPTDRLATARALSNAKIAPTKTNEAGQVEVEANANGFSPSKIFVEAGKPVKLLFTRTVEKTCMDGVVIPSLEIEKELAVGVPVEIEFTPEETGTIGFQCPMGHGKSSIIVLPKS